MTKPAHSYIIYLCFIIKINYDNSKRGVSLKNKIGKYETHIFSLNIIIFYQTKN